MRVLLVSTYELGHQPLQVASPAAALEHAGHQVRALDLSVQEWDPSLLTSVDAVAMSVPMHTAMRLGLELAAGIRTSHPELPLCFYGLYAPVSAGLTTTTVADRVIAGEYEPALVRWVDGLATRTVSPAPPEEPVVELERHPFHRPARQLLPPLTRYAKLAVVGELRTAGYVEASHGCAHRCRHCPVPTVYRGRVRTVPDDDVVADVAQQVAAGARHLTFGDPDFLNAPQHSLRVVRAVHERFPDLTFDCTAKVEHILRHAGLWGELAASGCLFVVSAVETVNDAILRILDKGHTAADAGEAVESLRSWGIEMRPSWMPFTPWTSVDDLVDLVEFVVAHDLVGNVDPVQYTIRLLLPEGSLLLEHPRLQPHLGTYDSEALSHSWHGDPAVEALQRQLSRLVEDGVAAGEDLDEMFERIRASVHLAAGRPRPARLPPSASRPRLTESWFCCAEPTARQIDSARRPA